MFDAKNWGKILMPIVTVIYSEQSANNPAGKPTLEEKRRAIVVVQGANLRHILLEHDLSPYTRITQRLNCGGRGLCATCGVWVYANEPAPTHWHDKLAQSFGYPRLSCQITVQEDMTVRLLDDKWIWGGRDAKRAGVLHHDFETAS